MEARRQSSLRETANTAPRYGETLLESDAAYFEASARLEALSGAVLAWMQGLEMLAAGGVVHRIEPDLAGWMPELWVEMVEAAMRRVGRVGMRLYLTAPLPTLEAVLRRRGYRSRLELGFARVISGRPARAAEGGVALHLVDSEAEWKVKLALHECCQIGPDGHPAPAREWVAMERSKAEAGYMRPFLVLKEGAVCGAVSLGWQGSLGRMKNLVLHPDWRHRRVGPAVLVALDAEIAASGRSVQGCFAVQGGEGERLYRRSGFRVVAQQTEWTRENAS